jgi:hypothetical protein
MTTKVSKSDDPMDVYSVIERVSKVGRMSKFRVIQIKTTARETHVVVRNVKGRKLFDMWIPGVILAISVPLDAEIKIEPQDSLTTKQLMEAAIQTVKQMSPQEKAELRKRLDQQLKKRRKEER